MGQSSPFTRISDLFARDQEHPSDAESIRGEHALNLFEETFRSIDAMSNDDRDIMMKHLLGWMMTGKFGHHARSAIQGLQKYCIAECLFEDPAWEASVILELAKGKPTPSDYAGGH